MEEKLSEEELDLLEKKHSLDRMNKEREHAKNGRRDREKLAVKGGYLPVRQAHLELLK